MKTIPGFCLLTLLFACGEPRIKSIDDETLAKAQALKDEAALSNAQTALLGTWQACADQGEKGSIRYSYSFGPDGQSAFQRNTYTQAACDDETGQSQVDKLRLPYRLTPAKDTPYILSFDLGAGHRFESEYQQNGIDTVLLPKIFELKDKGLPLLGLKEAENFVSLARIPVEAIDVILQDAEKDLLAFTTSLLKRPGTWNQVCTQSAIISLQFSGDDKLSLTSSQKKFTDTLCKTPAAEAAVTVNYKVDSMVVYDLATKRVQLNLIKDDKSKVEARVEVRHENLGEIRFNNFVEGKDTDLPLIFEAKP